jgi:hypothetical protein
LLRELRRHADAGGGAVPVRRAARRRAGDQADGARPVGVRWRSRIPACPPLLQFVVAVDGRLSSPVTMATAMTFSLMDSAPGIARWASGSSRPPV